MTAEVACCVERASGISVRLRPESLRVANEVTTAEWRMLVTSADLGKVESGNLTGMWGLNSGLSGMC